MPATAPTPSTPPAMPMAIVVDAWNAALRDGSELSFEDAIAYALADGR